MSARALVILVVLLAGAAVALVWLDRAPATTNTVAPIAPLVPPFKEADLRSIDVECSGPAFRLSREGSGGWRIASAGAAEADPRAVRELLASLQDARRRKVIADHPAHAESFGLEPAICTARIDAGTTSPALTVRLGRSSPVGSERYAEGDDGRVVLTDGSLYGALSRGVEAYRERRLIPVDPETISRIALERPDGTLVLSRSGASWRLEAPRAEPASSSVCNDLARALTRIAFVDGTDSPAPAGSRPERRVRVAVSTGSAEPPRIAFIAAAGIHGRRVAWRDGALRAGLVDESAASALEKPAAEFEATPKSPAGGS
jgi:hypothetical protein